MLSPGVSPTNQQVGRSKTQPERRVGTMSNYMTRTPARSLSVGQIIRGEVTDLRNNEITVTMEDNTVVTGHLQEGTNLSIGETAAFYISNIQPDRISLELVQKSLQSSEQITIQKALKEANLPQNEKNESIVRELLNNDMPIHKQSIMNILTQTYQFKDVSISTLVAMNRLGMEITDATTAQFENCLTHKHTLTSQATELTAALTSYLKDSQPIDAEFIRHLLQMTTFSEEEFIDEPVEEIISESIPTPPPPSTSLLPNGLSNIFGFNRLAGLLNKQTAPKTPSNSASQQTEQINTGIVSSEDKENFTTSLSSFTENQKTALEEMAKPEKPMNPMAFYQKPTKISEELQTLLEKLNQFSEKSEEILSKEELPLRDAISLFQEARQLADDIDFFQINEVRNHFLEKHPEFPEMLENSPNSKECEELSSQLEHALAKVPVSSSLLPSSLMEKMQEDYSQYLINKGTIVSLLSSEELSELHSYAKNFPFQPEVMERIADGDISTEEFFNLLNNTSSLVNDNILQSMAASSAFGKLFEQSFLASFAMTPKELSKPEKVEEFYDKTYEKLQNISNTLSQYKNSNGSDFLDLAGQKSNAMQKQLEFLKDFNQMFTYVQLPVKLKNGMRSGDLYVYTKKENIRQQPEQLSVLLHLDMDHLGPLDIHLSLHHATVSSQIYCDDLETKKFLSSQLPALKTALNLKGYLFNAEINERKNSFHFVRDFIQQKEEKEATEEKPLKKRYTFDIRA